MTGSSKVACKPDRASALVLLLLLLFSPPVHGSAVHESSGGTDQEMPHMQAFHPISQDEGWLLLGQHLYWTSTAGRSWTDITPPRSDGLTIQAVTFLDADMGWMILAQGEQSSSVEYTLTRTSDGGRTWHTDPVSLFEPGAPESFLGAVYLFFLDSRTGWLVVRQATSSNFRLGSLFRTTDGGDTWTRQSIPIGEPVYFVTQEVGWTVGGAAGDGLYRTLDGGFTWRPQTIDEPLTDVETRRFYHLPHFDDQLVGTLPVTVVSNGSLDVELYSTSDGGWSWILVTRVPLDAGVLFGDQIALGVVDTHTWIVAIPNHPQLLRISDRSRSAVINSGTPLSAEIVELDMATADVGWAKAMSGNCSQSSVEADSRGASMPMGVCHQKTALLRTVDGGANWIEMLLPQTTSQQTISGEFDGVTAGPSIADAVALLRLNSRTQTWIGQGFDKCEIPTLGELQTWKASSPYGAVNLYIGGSCRGCPNSGLTADYVAQASQQGWKFIPTWVGLQSACWSSPYCDRISNDPTTAYNQGIAEADSALAVAIDLGLALPDGSGTIIYYDLEGYGGTDPTCRAAAQAFISGWTGRLHSVGSQSGVYGSSCSSAISDFAYIANVPDAVWPAAWIYGYYNPNATVWGVACLGDDFWANHERIRQYAGGHNETWGGVTFNIDCNVIDGIVAGVGGGSCCGCGKVRTADKQSLSFTPESFRSPSLASYTSMSAPSAIQPVAVALLPDPTATAWPAAAFPPTAIPKPTATPQPVAMDEPLAPSSIPIHRDPVEAQRTPPASENYRIPKSVFGSGGGEKTSTHFVMNGTQGQGTDLSRRQSASYVLAPGYWGQWTPLVYDHVIHLPLVIRNH